MRCQEIESNDVAERYLHGTLPEAESEAFEQHFFSCRRCLERLETLQGLPFAFAQTAPEAKPRYVVWALAACLVLAAGAGVVLRMQPQVLERVPAATVTLPPPIVQDALAELAKFDPPRYDPARFRGSQTPAMRAFQAGMARYRQGAFAEAAKDLARAAELDPADAGAPFFLGICQLLAGETGGGIELLRRVDAMGFTPYQEEARFYLAKALLQQGDAESARAALLTIERMNGDLAAQARALLDRMNAVRPPA